jgi:hypothetical protein
MPRGRFSRKIERQPEIRVQWNGTLDSTISDRNDLFHNLAWGISRRPVNSENARPERAERRRKRE